MRLAVILTLCLCGCAQARPSTGSPDLATPPPRDLAATSPDLARPDPPDFAGSTADLTSSPDLTSPPADLAMSAPDLAMSTRDLAMSTPDLAMSTPDLSGPPADLATPTYTYPRINEVATGVGGNVLDEYIELVGGDTDTALFGWSLRYQPSPGILSEQLLAFPLLAVLPAHRYLLIAASGSMYSSSADQLYTSTITGRLADSGGSVALMNGLTKVDSVGWGTAANPYVEGAAAPAPGSQSCSRYPDGIDTDRNNVDFVVTPPTPRIVNRR